MYDMYGMIFFLFEIIGTIAFAASGALTGIHKHMDLLGVCVLGCVTAVGGGVIRDVILGLTPPKTFENPVYIIVAILTSIVCFLPIIRAELNEKAVLNTLLMKWMDAIGLGIFTVLGIQTAQLLSEDNGISLLIFVGVITGVGGGVLRDVMAGERPYIFYKHFYASASIIGAIVCSITWNYIDIPVNMLLSSVLIILLRLFAARFHWKLPSA